MKYLLATISLLFLSLLTLSPSYASQIMNRPVICGPFVDIQKELIKNYGENKDEIIGISEQGLIVHVKFSSEKTYTIVEMHVSGMACILGAGELITPGSTL